MPANGRRDLIRCLKVNVLDVSITVHYFVHVRYKSAHSIVVGRLNHKQNGNDEE